MILSLIQNSDFGDESQPSSPDDVAPLIEQLPLHFRHWRLLLVIGIILLLFSGAIGFMIGGYFAKNDDAYAALEDELRIQDLALERARTAHTKTRDLFEQYKIAQEKAAPPPAPAEPAAPIPDRIDTRVLSHPLAALALRLAQGEPYSAELAASRDYLDNIHWNALATHANTGIATQLDLINALTHAERQIAQRPLRPNNVDNALIRWLKKLGIYFIRIRHAPTHTLTTRIIEAHRLLREGDVVKARAQLFTIHEPALVAWHKAAHAYIETRAARRLIFETTTRTDSIGESAP